MDTKFSFIEWLLGPEPCYISLASKIASSVEDSWEQSIFAYPSDENEMVEYMNTYIGIANMYFCPTPLNARKRIKKNIPYGYCLWADLDQCHPDSLLIKPTIVVETSPDRFQAYWKLKEKSHALDIEETNRNIAYRHKDDGCDISGWDLTQLLRIPGTFNFKYLPNKYVVKIHTFNKDAMYDLQDFKELYPPIEKFAIKPTVPFPRSLPNITSEEVLDKLANSINPRVWKLYEETPVQDWSITIWNLQLMLFEAGATRDEVFIVARDSACNKFKRDGLGDEVLWKEVLRAEQQANSRSTVSDEEIESINRVPDEPLLTEQERSFASLSSCIIDDYVEWGTEVCDAPAQYHVAGAFIILSTLLSGSIKLATSFGTIIPNMWFMILADTTLTRKSTSMDMAMDIIADVAPDSMLATDGTIEGLMQAMSTRPGIPSIFLRDEFSGLLELMAKRDYYAGMLEALTKLYDNKLLKRTLKKEVIEVRDPVFIMFTGGIKERIYQLLTFNHINSGFIPRFCFVTAVADFTKIRPLGPPTNNSTENRQKLLERFRDISDAHSLSGRRMNDYKAVELTPEAWKRFNEIEMIMQNIGYNSSIPDLLTPVMTRLGMSGLKAACLISASESKDDTITVTLDHIVKAFSYVEEWKAHAIHVVMNSGKTVLEKQLENVYEDISKTGAQGISRSILMQKHKLTAREADNIFSTLEGRGLIKHARKSGSRYYYPTSVVRV